MKRQKSDHDEEYDTASGEGPTLRSALVATVFLGVIAAILIRFLI